MKLALAAALGAGLLLAIAVSRRCKLVLLFAWVVSLTYNRQYFSFETLAGDNSSQGPYWIVADVFLLLLLAIWAYDVVVRRQLRRPQSLAVHVSFLPFALIGLVSALGAERPDWSLYELVRALKVIVIFLYVRYNFTREEWWTCAAAMACAAAFQGGLGTLEVATGRSGVQGVLGLGNAALDIPDELRPEQFYGWHRATGTMNHPPNLACYLLLILPLPLAVALSGAPRLIRVIAGGVAVIALAGLACTLSRWPWVLAIGQVLGLLFALTWLRILPVVRTFGVLSAGGLAVVVATLPLIGFVADRFTRDFERSISFRANENRVALAMFADHPVLGVGLNNYKLHLETYGSEMVWALDNENLAVRTLRLRFLAAPQNGFLLPLAETGLVGFVAFLLYLGTALFVGVKAVAASRGWHVGATLGLTIGIAGVIAQQLIDYSFWIDPVLYTFTLIVAMLAVAPVLEQTIPHGSPA